MGLEAGKNEDESARLIHDAAGLGINFIDIVASYGTEGVVGEALETIPRNQVVIVQNAIPTTYERRSNEAAAAPDNLPG